MSNLYNIRDHKTGTTFEGMELKIEVNGAKPELSSVSMSLTGRLGGAYTLSTAGGISILGAGLVMIDKQLISWTVDTYRFVMTFTLSTGEIKRWMEGNWRII